MPAAQAEGAALLDAIPPIGKINQLSKISIRGHVWCHAPKGAGVDQTVILWQWGRRRGGGGRQKVIWKRKGVWGIRKKVILYDKSVRLFKKTQNMAIFSSLLKHLWAYEVFKWSSYKSERWPVRKWFFCCKLVNGEWAGWGKRDFTWQGGRVKKSFMTQGWGG